MEVIRPLAFRAPWRHRETQRMQEMQALLPAFFRAQPADALSRSNR